MVPALAEADIRLLSQVRKEPLRKIEFVFSARGGELEQIQFLLGHMSVQTTEPYLGCKQ